PSGNSAPHGGASRGAQPPNWLLTSERALRSDRSSSTSKRAATGEPSTLARSRTCSSSCLSASSRPRAAANHKQTAAWTSEENLGFLRGIARPSGGEQNDQRQEAAGERLQLGPG